DSIISALVTLSLSLHISVVAEGVETPEHYTSVAKLGCDLVQGYPVAKPMPADAFANWFNDATGKRPARWTRIGLLRQNSRNRRHCNGA
ncbi:MAG: EAL domain-containing protein, partial [Roseobacter sp.]